MRAGCTIATVVLVVAFGANCDDRIHPFERGCSTHLDLGSANWLGTDARENARFGAFAQGITDTTAAAHALVADAGNACHALALELGAPPDAVTATSAASHAEGWCATATARIDAVLAAGPIVITAQPVGCMFFGSTQGTCDAACALSERCVASLSDVQARCAPEHLAARCDGSCSGRCEGSSNVAIDCDGSCAGVCEGSCSGAPSSGGCTGTCSGRCRGTCTSADGVCDFDCNGACTGATTAPKCTAPLLSPEATCAGPRVCHAACAAGAAARAHCNEPAVDVAGSARHGREVIASLEAHLPRLLLVERRAHLVVDAIRSAPFLPRVLLPEGGDQAILCLPHFSRGLVQSLADLDIALAAVTTTLDRVR